MTIEKSPVAAKPASRSDAHAVKPKAGTADTAQPQTGGGFMAILGALGDGVTETSDAPLVADDTAPQITESTPVLFDAGMLLQQNPQIAAAQVAAQSALAGAASEVADAGNAVSLMGGVQSPTLPVPTVADTLPAPGQTVAIDNAALGEQVPVRSAASQAVRPTPGPVGAQPDATDSAGNPALALQGEGAKAKPHLRPWQDSAATPTGSGSNANPAQAMDRPEAKDTRLMAAVEQAKSAMQARSAEPILVPLLAKQDKPQSERTTQSGKSADPTYAASTQGVSAPDFSLTNAPGTTLAPDMQVAEQVTYWVSQNVQNAELKLDGLGDSAVEVSIRMQGNEAQIAFRSDEQATRGVLESAGAHLKDMLQREGVVLTGVSVGTSGGGESGAGERRDRQPVRQVAIAPLKVTLPTAGLRGGAQSGRSVDLFV